MSLTDIEQLHDEVADRVGAAVEQIVEKLHDGVGPIDARELQARRAVVVRVQLFHARPVDATVWLRPGLRRDRVHVRVEQPI